MDPKSSDNQTQMNIVATKPKKIVEEVAKPVESKKNPISELSKSF